MNGFILNVLEFPKLPKDSGTVPSVDLDLNIVPNLTNLFFNHNHHHNKLFKIEMKCICKTELN